MHELSVASSIANSVVDFARKNDAKEVLEVRLAVGELTSLAIDQLKFCYQTVSKGSMIEGSVLNIEEVEAVVACSHCSYEGPPKRWEGALHFVDLPTLECPKCGKGAKPIQGKECTVKNIKYVN